MQICVAAGLFYIITPIHALIPSGYFISCDLKAFPQKVLPDTDCWGQQVYNLTWSRVVQHQIATLRITPEQHGSTYRKHPLRVWVCDKCSRHCAIMSSVSTAVSRLWQASCGPAVQNRQILSQGLIKSPASCTTEAVTWWMASDFLYKVILTLLNTSVCGEIHNILESVYTVTLWGRLFLLGIKTKSL